MILAALLGYLLYMDKVSIWLAQDLVIRSDLCFLSINFDLPLTRKCQSGKVNKEKLKGS